MQWAMSDQTHGTMFATVLMPNILIWIDMFFVHTSTRMDLSTLFKHSSIASSANGLHSIGSWLELALVRVFLLVLSYALFVCFSDPIAQQATGPWVSRESCFDYAHSRRVSFAMSTNITQRPRRQDKVKCRQSQNNSITRHRVFFGFVFFCITLASQQIE